ncbi:MAG: glycosyltransferase family 2 protein [Acidobacteriota bacterium]
MSASHAPTAPRTTVVVVNYDGGERLWQCLDALAADGETDRELVVVDNGPPDAPGIRPRLEAFADAGRCELLTPARNLGYAGAINLALARAKGQYLAVLNMDVAVEPGWLDPLVCFLDAHRHVAAVNPALLLAGGQCINATGQEVHVSGLGFNRGLGAPRAELPSAPFEVAGLQGAAFVVRRDMLQELGGMDAAGFLYHEDVNLSWLLRLAGHELWCVPASVVHHDYTLSMQPQKFHYLERNRLALLAAYPRLATLLLLSPWLLATELMAWGFAALRGIPFVRAKASGYGWLLRRRGELMQRRRLVQSLRRVGDRKVVRHLRFGYLWRQFLVLGRER